MRGKRQEYKKVLIDVRFEIFELAWFFKKVFLKDSNFISEK